MSNEAFNFNHEIQAKRNSTDISSWRHRVDDNLRYFTQEYIVEANITKFSYGLRRDQNGIPNQVYSIGYKSDGDILESFKKGEGKRARAECFGFGQKIERPLFKGEIENNDFFVWHSPPGKKEDGFKDHSFTFIGQILDDRVDMVAYRNHLCKENSINFLNRFLSDDEEKLDQNATDIDFLRNPVFIKGRERFASYMDIIHALDPKRSIWKAESCRWLLDKLQPLRRDILKALEDENIAEAERNKIAHDNYALKLLRGEITEANEIAVGNKELYDARKRQLIDMGAPVLRGSCGFSGKIGGEAMTWNGAEENYFECPKCQGHIQKGKGITTCPHCGAKKEDYGTKCD